MPRIRNVGGVRPLPFFIRSSGFKLRTTGNGTGTNNVFIMFLNGIVHLDLSLVSSLLSTALLL